MSGFKANESAVIGDLYCKLVEKDSEIAQLTKFIKAFEAEAGKKFAAMEAELKALKEPAAKEPA